MAYIGVAPANAALTADDITDGIISTAKLQNDAVDNTKLDLADNFAFTGTVTGTPVGLTLLSTNTVSGTSTSVVEFNDLFTSTYENYRVYISEASAITGSDHLYARFRKGASSITSSNYVHIKGGATRNISTDDSGNEYNAGEGTSMNLTGPVGISSNILYSSSVIVDIPNPLNTTSHKSMKWNISFIANDNVSFYTYQGSGWLNDDATALSGVNFFMSSGNIKAPTKFRLYGVNV
jgi:hypothetical protein